MDLYEIADAIEPYALDALEATGTPGGVLTIADREGELIELAYGTADVAGEEPMSPLHTFHGGSFSKMYIGMAVGQLSELHAVDPHAPIGEYGIDVTNPYGQRPITLEDLLSHRAGLAVDTYDARIGDAPPDAAGLLGADACAPEYGGVRPRWEAPVGERFTYSSAGLALAAEVVEHVTGLPWPEYVRREITAPLGMTLTAWPGSQEWESAAAVRMTGHMVFGDTCVPTPAIGSKTSASAGIVTSAGDHTRLLVALLNKGTAYGHTLMLPATVRRLTVPRCEYTFFGKPIGMHMGLGIETRGLGSEREAIGHAGAYPYGWWSVSWAHRHLDLAVTAASNAWDMRQYGYLPGSWPWLVADEVARLRAGGEPATRQHPAYVAGLLTAERLHGLLGMPGVLSEDELLAMIGRARPLPGVEVAEWAGAEFFDGVHAFQNAHTPEEIRARLAAVPGLAQYVELVGLRWGARSLLLDPNLGA